MFGKHNAAASTASTPNILASMRIQTSSFGQSIPILYGTNRLAGKLIWYGDFLAIPHTSTQSTGGKGGGGSQKTTTTTYTYQAAVAILLSQGTVYGMMSMWDTKGNRLSASTTEDFTIPSSPFQITVANASTFIADLGVTVDASYSQPVDDFGSDGLLTLSGTQFRPTSRVTSSPATLQYTVTSGGLYTFAAADAGKSIHVTYSYAGTGGTPTTAFNLTIFKGTQPQTPWGYLTTNHAGQDLSYAGFAYAASPSIDLGDSGSLPNLTFEIVGLASLGGAASQGDCDPRDVLNDIITNTTYGVGLSGSYVDANASYSNFCRANNLFISPVIESQTTAAQFIDEVCKLTNSAPLWSQGLLKILPYGDVSAVANGATYVADTQPRYALTEDDFLVDKQGDEPIHVSRVNPADVKNSLSIEWSDRANSYNFVPCKLEDQSHVDAYGVNAETMLTAHMVCQQKVATAVVNHLLKRSIYIDGGSTYSFKLSWKYCLLEPMDVVTLTYTPLFGASVAYPVRIKEISEDEEGVLDVTCEEFPFGASNPVQSATQTASGYSPQQDADPPVVAQVLIYEPNNRTTQYNGYELWLLASANDPNFGGCNVYASQDGTTYSRVGQILRGGRMGGVRLATYPSHADPDTTNTLHVDMSHSSGGALSSASASDNNVFKNLALVGSELISFQTATLVGTNLFDLTTIHRGVFGTTPAAHVVGEQFVRLDDCVLKLDYAPEDIGKTINFKFASFNTFGAREQSLAACTAYPITIGGVLGAFDGGSGSYVLGLDAIPDGVVYIRPTATRLNNATDVNGNLLLKNISTVYGTTTTPTYTSNTPAVVPEMSITLTTRGNKVLVELTLSGGNSTFGDIHLAIYRDGTNIFQTSQLGTVSQVFTLSVVDIPSAGSHTYEARWWSNSTPPVTWIANFTERTLQVVELG